MVYAIPHLTCLLPRVMRSGRKEMQTVTGNKALCMYGCNNYFLVLEIHLFSYMRHCWGECQCCGDLPGVLFDLCHHFRQLRHAHWLVWVFCIWRLPFEHERVSCVSAVYGPANLQCTCEQFGIRRSMLRHFKGIVHPSELCR